MSERTITMIEWTKDARESNQYVSKLRQIDERDDTDGCLADRHTVG